MPAVPRLIQIQEVTQLRLGLDTDDSTKIMSERGGQLPNGLPRSEASLSRRFYRALPVKIIYLLWPAETRVLGA